MVKRPTTGAYARVAHQRNQPSGPSSQGRIARILTGQNHGFITDAHGRAVFFHRDDVVDGMAFGEFAVGDDVAFELIDDRLSGPRAIRVTKETKTGR
jgi:cold shock CspA family protein